MIDAMRLEWTEHQPPNSECPYNHTTALTPFGRFRIEWKGWKEFDSRDITETPWGLWSGSYCTLEDAKQGAQEQWEAKLWECVVAVDSR